MVWSDRVKMDAVAELTQPSHWGLSASSGARIRTVIGSRNGPGR